MPTQIAYNSPQANVLQSAGLFAVNMQRPTTINRLAGKLPTQKDAEGQLRLQSSNYYPIVRCMDLTKMAGDKVEFDLINPMSGEPIMGEEMAEGRGRSMNFSQDSLYIDQYRYPISAGGQMTQKRTPYQLRLLARAQAENYMLRLQDQLPLVQMAGARGFANDIEWVIPLDGTANFDKIMINDVKAPTRNRHFMSNGSGIEQIAASGNEITIATTDVMNSDLLDDLRTFLDGMALAPPPCKFDGDVMAEDSPIRVLMVSSEQYTSILKSTNFRTLQSQAYARASQAKNHPIFMGDAGLWNNILIVKMPKPIRFFAGDAINWCAATTSTTETTTDLVPSAFSTTHAVDRAILLGGQALAQALGKTRQTGNPFFWSEKELDHGDKLEVLIGMISGTSKIRFKIDHGSEEQYTDYGVMAIDTAVNLSGR